MRRPTHTSCDLSGSVKVHLHIKDTDVNELIEFDTSKFSTEHMSIVNDKPNMNERPFVLYIFVRSGLHTDFCLRSNKTLYTVNDTRQGRT